MENMRRGESRKGQPQNNVPGRTDKKDNDQASKGFEGMNYEQKRKPYNETDRSEKDWDRNIDNDSKTGRRYENR